MADVVVFRSVWSSQTNVHFYKDLRYNTDQRVCLKINASLLWREITREVLPALANICSRKTSRALLLVLCQTEFDHDHFFKLKHYGIVK